MKPLFETSLLSAVYHYFPAILSIEFNNLHYPELCSPYIEPNIEGKIYVINLISPYTVTPLILLGDIADGFFFSPYHYKA